MFWNFETLDEGGLLALIRNGVTESISLEYKSEPYGTKDEEKKEFLKDLSALANTSGGTLLIGVEEVDGAASCIKGIASTEIDKFILRFEESYRTGLEPTLHGVKIRNISTYAGEILAIHVPKSASPPHRVIFKNSNRYYLRHSKGVFEASYNELKNMFLQTANAGDRAVEFHRSRIRLMRSPHSAIGLTGQAERLVVHVLPIGTAGHPFAVKFSSAQQDDQLLRPMGNLMGYSPRMNVDGFAITTGGDDISSYTQLFRNGSLEAVQAGYLQDLRGAPCIQARAIVKTLFDALPRFVDAQQKLGVAPPLYVAVTLTQVTGARVICRDSNDLFHGPPVLRAPDLNLPICLIEDFGSADDYKNALKPALDALWNAGGYTEWTPHPA